MNTITFYHSDGSVDWFKTIVNKNVIYRDSFAFFVESAAAVRAQKKYRARERNLVLSSSPVTINGGKKIRIPLNYGETLMEPSYSEFAQSMARYEECDLDDTLMALEANLAEYNSGR